MWVRFLLGALIKISLNKFGRRRVAMVKWLSLEFVALSLRVRFPLATLLRLNKKTP